MSLPPLPTLPPLPDPTATLPSLPSLPEPVSAPAQHQGEFAHQLRERTDPYWDGVWTLGSQAVWSTADDVRSQKAAGLLPSRALSAMDPESAHEVFAHDTVGRPRRIALASLLDSWGTVTGEQAQHFTGHRQVGLVDDKSVNAMFSTGILDIGRVTSALRVPTKDPSSVLLRTGDAGAARSQWTPNHSSVELWQIDGGVTDTPKTGYFDRHNVLSAELALRSVEINPQVLTCFGEKYAASNLLFPADYRKASTFTPGRRNFPARGDGCLVLTSGVRVITELTASTSEGFRNKVSRWAQVLDRHPLATSGLFVLFVVAPHPGRDGKISTANVGKIRRDINEVLKKHNPAGVDSAHARIGVVSWADWFPARHEVSQKFMDLNVTVARGGWGEHSIIHDTPAPTDGAAVAAGHLDASRLLGATPWWLRRQDASELVGSRPCVRMESAIPIPPSTADPDVPARLRPTKVLPRLRVLAHTGFSNRGGARTRGTAAKPEDA